MKSANSGLDISLACRRRAEGEAARAGDSSREVMGVLWIGIQVKTKIIIIRDSNLQIKMPLKEGPKCARGVKIRITEN